MSAPEPFLVADESGMRQLEPEWRRLARDADRPSIFSTPEWNRTWWRHFARGRELHIAGLRERGELVGLLPMCRTRGPAGSRIREFLGTEEADLAPLLLAPGRQDLAPRLVQCALEGARWDLLDLWCVPGDAADARAWAQVLGRRGVRFAVTPLTTNPVVPIPSSGDLHCVRRSALRSVSRKRRGLARDGRLALAFPGSAADVDRALEELQALHGARWAAKGEVSRLLVPGYWRWVRELTLEAHRLGWLYLPRLTLDGHIVATGVYFLYGRRLFYWIGGFDLAYAHRSPYQVLTLCILENLLVSRRADLFDFGRGSEPYKIGWTGAAEPLLRVMAWHGTRGAAAFLWRGRVRPWAWAHQRWSRPLRGLKRSLQRLAASRG